MALIECSECSGKVSTTGSACPHCGAPVVKAATPKPEPTVQPPPAQTTTAALQVSVPVSGLAVASLVCGISAIWFEPFSLPAIICGLWALLTIRRSRGSRRGTALAFAGTILGCVMFTMLTLSIAGVRRAAEWAATEHTVLNIGIAIQQSLAFRTGNTQEAISLPPDQRLSWMTSLLPHLDRNDLYHKLQFGEEWNSPKNADVTSVIVPEFQSHLIADRTNNTHFVGMAGVGANAAELPYDDPRAGVFGYNRKPSLDNISDGSSMTIMLMTVQNKLGPWAQGGSSTVRGLSAQPYIGGPDGFGCGASSPRQKDKGARGAIACFADGSVRFISETVDPRVLEALATTNGTRSGEQPVTLDELGQP